MMDRMGYEVFEDELEQELKEKGQMTYKSSVLPFFSHNAVEYYYDGSRATHVPRIFPKRRK